MRSSRFLLAVVLVTVALGAAAWLIVSVGEMHDRLERHSAPLALAFVTAAGLVAMASGLMAARLFWTLGRPERAPAQAPEDVVRAAEVQAEKAEGVIAQIRDEAAKVRLNAELVTLRADRSRDEFRVVVFGTGSAGKTSLINALIGQAVGAIEATMGTTRHGETHTHAIEGVEGKVFLTDTPGLSEI